MKLTASKKGVEISSLAFYPDTMDADLEKRAANDGTPENGHPRLRTSWA